MNTTATPALVGADPRIDRLYALLPAVHRRRDADQGYVLQALLRVIAEQVDIVEDDITRLYDDWFIETADDWAVPYIGDLVGYRPTAEGALPPDAPCCEQTGVLVPRREIANLIRYRRRKGTLALLELLANDIGGWPAHAVEYFKRLGWNQHLDHLHRHRHRVVDLRQMDALDRLGGPFDPLAHTVDVRRIDSARTRGRHNLPSIGVFVWRLLSLPVTRLPAYCVEQDGPQCFTFSVLGHDGPLFVKPQPEPTPTHISQELNVPAPIRRLAFKQHLERYYGSELSLAIWADGWNGNTHDQPIPRAQIVAADLSDWRYVAANKTVAVDPVLGRIAFPPAQLPKKGVRVSCRYGFPAEIGGGEYPRPLLQQPGSVVVYRVGDDPASFAKIGDALAQWRTDAALNAVIEITASAVYVEQLDIALGVDQSLQIRAANRTRAVLRLIDWQTDRPDALVITLARGSRFTLDGLLVTGRPVQVQGAPADTGRNEVCPAELMIRHCTLVPGWGTDCDCLPARPGEPGLELSGVRARVCVEHSIVGPIVVQEDEVGVDPIPLSISDSIVDACAAANEAVCAPGAGWAHVVLDIRRCTVFGIVDVHAIQLAENTIFSGCVNVARRQLGCMRFCYVPARCRTPKRYHCQPDGVIAAAQDSHPDPTQRTAAIERESERVAPQFTATRYGQPAYAQLGAHCAVEIVRGADDESEMGVYHHLFQPLRAASLQARLAEFMPAGLDVGIFFVN